ncbi:unnamed protein product [Citrullus colocynthis]|uniref:Cotton fiber protein n=1 Tax=Citrullus colocynthis TaxID=252529 RepID=A0ABP0YDZ0_9ROSI
MKRPIIPNLLFFRKSFRSNNFELLQHYNYRFLPDFQFSPSTTPLFRFYKGRRRLRLRLHDVYSVLFPCRCIGSSGAGNEEDGDHGEAFPAIEGRFPDSLDWSDDDDSIDRRAELFIQKFYADMKMERLASI